VKTISGSDEPQRLLATEERKLVTDWSPDGRVVLYQTYQPKSGADLWALPLDADRRPFPIVATPFDETAGQFSPDGQWIAYASNATGRDEIYVRPFAGSAEEVQVSSGGGSQPRWRRDGKELYFVGLDGRLTAVPVTIAADGHGIATGAPVRLFAARLATGPNVYLGQTQYVVAADGRFLLNVSTDDAAVPPISIVLNWDAALRN